MAAVGSKSASSVNYDSLFGSLLVYPLTSLLPSADTSANIPVPTSPALVDVGAVLSEGFPKDPEHAERCSQFPEVPECGRRKRTKTTVQTQFIIKVEDDQSGELPERLDEFGIHKSSYHRHLVDRF